jgi:hypothetical protein
VSQALASVRLEGLEPGYEALSIYQRYVDGELTLEQMGAQVEALHDREYGPDLYPGTDVLRNLCEIRNPAALSRFEAESTARRIVELIHTPVQADST